jgi:hypothetical protein
VLNSLSFKSVHGSLHWESEPCNVNLVQHNIGNLRDVNRMFRGWDVLFDVNKSNLWDLNGVLIGWDHLFDHDEMNLWDLNRVFVGWHNLFD